MGYGPLYSKAYSQGQWLKSIKFVKNPKLEINYNILKGHTDWVTDVKLTADNKWIVSVGKVYYIS